MECIRGFGEDALYKSTFYIAILFTLHPIGCRWHYGFDLPACLCVRSCVCAFVRTSRWRVFRPACRRPLVVKNIFSVRLTPYSVCRIRIWIRIGFSETVRSVRESESGFANTANPVFCADSLAKPEVLSSTMTSRRYHQSKRTTMTPSH